MSNSKALIEIKVFADGNFTVHDAASGIKLEELEDDHIVDILANGTEKVKKGSFVNPLMTYLKINSGIIIIGGRRFFCPTCP